MEKLIYKHGNPHHFEIIRYPDGQKNIELDLSYFNSVKEPIHIMCSVRNFDELEVLLCLVAALRRCDFAITGITFNYLFGMRSDRSFAPGQPNYFRDVLAKIINQIDVKKMVLSPHSKLAMCALRQATPISAPQFKGEYDCYVIGADQSANWDQWIHSPDDPHFHKERRDGKVLIGLCKQFQSKIKELPAYKPILVKDDLCDGGATFEEIGNFMNDHFPERQLFLYVTHGLFTKGLDELLKYYDKIITTNSYQEFPQNPNDPLGISTDDLEVIDVWK